MRYLIFSEGVEGFPERPHYEDSTAVVMQIIINNFDSKSTRLEDVEGLRKAKAWEKKFIEFMKDWEATKMDENIMDVAYTSERSVEDELDRETYGDLATIAVSYIIMFLYITLALGQYGSSLSLTGFIIESKITLGLFGVMIVLLSVFASIGIFGFIGVPATLIIFEIIPFLVRLSQLGYDLCFPGFGSGSGQHLHHGADVPAGQETSNRDSRGTSRTSCWLSGS